MTTALTRLSGSAFEITITVPWSDVKSVYDKVFQELASEIEIEGFRKGKAPKEILESKVDKSKVYGEVVNRILPSSYTQALEQHNLKPVVSPKVQIAQAQEEKDWQFIAHAAEKPSVNLNDYKKQISAMNAKSKIWKPGQDVTPPSSAKSPNSPGSNSDQNGDEERSKKISQVIDKLLEICQVELPEILTESEVNRLLTQLIDDVRKAGLTYEQYLQSSSQTADSVREKYRSQAVAALKLEFILDALADDLKIEVDPQEIETIINKETDPVKKQALTEQSYLITSVLRRENTITKLLSL